MKAFWIMGLAVALSGCAVPPATTTSVAPITTGVTLATVTDCTTWRVSDGFVVCKGDPQAERPQEIVGTEAHHLVLDGAS